MKLSELRVACPSCGSQEVAYTCQPECCFNHVCESCLASFELSTELREGSAESAEATRDADSSDADSCRPTVACARCHGLNVYQLDVQDSPDKPLACGD